MIYSRLERSHSPVMGVSVQLQGLLLYILCSSVTSQSPERKWLTTTSNSPVTTPPVLEPSEDAARTEIKDVPPIVLAESLVDTKGSGESAEHVNGELKESVQSVLIDDKKEEGEGMEAEGEEAEGVEGMLESQNNKEEKPRKWISIPTHPTEEGLPPNLAEVTEQPLNTPAEEDTDPVVLNPTGQELPKNLSELAEAGDDSNRMVQEAILSSRTTIFMTFIGFLEDFEPLYVNLSGIRNFTGRERLVVDGCLDLSDLYITGEEAREVIQRMSMYNFDRIDLSNNNISELPINTFSSVAFAVQELRLDGNPLMSNNLEEGGGVVQLGGLFHLTELRELNLSRCGLRDLDFFTPWNSYYLEIVDLSCNNMNTVPTNLQFFHRLKKLFLDGNPITQITELPFALLWNLQVLSMNSCQVTSITSDPFRHMERLKELALDGNNLTNIGDVRLPRINSGMKMWLSGNPWHCSCEMLTFIEYYYYAIPDVDDIRCDSPRWLQGLRTAYLTKEILSLTSMDGDCSPSTCEVSTPMIHRYAADGTDRLELLALVVFVLAAAFMLVNIFCGRKKQSKLKFDEDHHDIIQYIKIEKKPDFK